MLKKDEFIENTFKALKQQEQKEKLTEQQKEIMLDHIMLNYTSANEAIIDRIKRNIVSYPWRFAFLLSTAQTVIFTMIFGTQYTNLFLGFFGG